MTSTVLGGASVVMLRDATSLILRSPRHLQFGTVPSHSLVLAVPDGVSANQVMLVLREARRPVESADLATRLGHCGFSPEHADGILDDLRTAGLLRPVPPTGAATVHVTGTTGMSGALLQELMRCGVTAAPVTPGAPAFGRLSGRSLVVLAGQLFPPQDVTHRLMEQGVPHLPCGVLDGQVVIGPLVQPGTTPCLTCIDTQMLAEDPEWRLVRAQAPVGEGRTASSMTGLAATVFAGIVRDILGERTTGGPAAVPAVRRFLDPVSLDVTEMRPVQVPGCPSCQAALSGSSG